jgi:hypothetical protein
MGGQTGLNLAKALSEVSGAHGPAARPGAGRRGRPRASCRRPPAGARGSAASARDLPLYPSTPRMPPPPPPPQNAPPLQSGILEKYGVELIGAKLPSIDRAEDRELFKQAMKRIGLKTPPSGTASTLEEALGIQVGWGPAGRLAAPLADPRAGLLPPGWPPAARVARQVAAAQCGCVGQLVQRPAGRPCRGPGAVNPHAHAAATPAAPAGRDRQVPADHPPCLHPRRHRRRHRIQHGGVQGDRAGGGSGGLW